MLGGATLKGRADYSKGPFTTGNLYAEFALDTHIAVTRLKGSILAASVASTRSDPKPAKNFLHLDLDADVDDSNTLLKVRATVAPSATSINPSAEA